MSSRTPGLEQGIHSLSALPRAPSIHTDRTGEQLPEEAVDDDHDDEVERS